MLLSKKSPNKFRTLKILSEIFFGNEEKIIGKQIEFTLQVSMSFGQKILEKYGYIKGDGLGKNSNGITEPIKANFKV